eukprot:6130452-Amphidinium_carterae.1
MGCCLEELIVDAAVNHERAIWRKRILDETAYDSDEASRVNVSARAIGHMGRYSAHRVKDNGRRCPQRW